MGIVVLVLSLGLLIIMLIGGSHIASLSNENSIACKGNAECISGQVTRVIDGDTVVVNDVHVRFALASAPELTEQGGIEAKKFYRIIMPYWF